MSNIAIIEYKSNIDEALRYFPPKECIYLSVSAEASYFLTKRHIDFLTDEDVLTSEEFKKIGNDNFGILEKWVQDLEKALQSRSPIFKERPFYPFQGNFYRLKILLDSVVVRKILLDKLIDREKPALIGIPQGCSPERIQDYNLFFYRYDSLYGFIARKIAVHREINIKVWKCPRPALTFVFDRGIVYLKNSMKQIKKLKEIFNLFGRQYKKTNILLGVSAYDVVALKQKLSDKFHFCLYENIMNFSMLESILKMIFKNKFYEFPDIDIQGVFRNIKITDDSIVDDILGSRIQKYAERFLLPLWKSLNCLEFFDDKLSFKAYLHHCGASDSFYGLPINYFTRRNRPVFIVQHGAYGLALNRQLEYCEFNHSGYFLSWGEGVKEMYEKRKKGSCSIIATGSHLIEGIKEKRIHRKRIRKVCYIPNSAYRGYFAYYPNGQPYLDSKLFILETVFLSTLKPYMERYQITYKMSPDLAVPSRQITGNPMPDWVRKNLPAVKIEYCPLQSIIHEFDLFIIDWPSTTVIQTCATGAEVLAYVGNKYQVLTSEAKYLLGKRAIISEDETDFQRRIRMILDKGIVVSNTQSQAFIERYGIHRDDQQSLQRMADNIEYILEERNYA